MYARILAGSLYVETYSDAINYFRLNIGPALRQQPGFLNARLLRNPTTDHCILLTLWETAADRQRADRNGAIQTLLGHLQAYCARPMVASDYELSAQVIIV